jgi:hypothetical protein
LETPDTIILDTAPGFQVRMTPADVVSKRPYRASMMPEGLLNNLAPQQIADLLAFLATLKKSSP